MLRWVALGRSGMAGVGRLEALAVAAAVRRKKVCRRVEEVGISVFFFVLN